MSVVVHDPDVVGDVDPEGEARDQVLIEEMLNEWTDEPQFCHDVYPESDGEDNADGPERVHTHIRRGDGHLYPKQTFFSGVAFKEAVVDYALRTGCNLKQYRYDQDKIGFKCVGNDGKEEGVRCEWQVYAASLPNDPMWKIRKFIDKHSCIPNGECEMFKVPHIARLFVDKIRENPEFYMPAKIEELIKEQWKISVTRNQCQAARKKARQWIEKEYDDQFARLRDYAAEILEANPYSHVEVDCLTEEGKGQLLVALGRDANNKIYPVAWGVVKVENTENWVWFVKNLKEDLGLGDGECFIMLSDRQKGLIKAVSLELPSIEHRMCVQHIYGNLKKNHGSKTRMKPLLWNLAWAYNEKDYKQHLEKIFCYDTVVFNDIMKTNPMSWCMAFQRRGNYCEDVDNNFTESFNGSLNKAREKPFVAMLETIRRLAMVRIAKRSVESHTHTGSCTPYVALVLSAEHKFASLAKVSTSTNGMYEVRHGLDSHRVCLKSYTCTCQKWQIRGIPCEHAYGVILDKKLAPEDYVCHWFRTSTWKKNYTDGLCPQRGPKFWPETQLPAVFNPQPPEGEKKMTKEDKKRKKGVNESPTKKAAKNKKRIMHCGICGIADHNSRGCQKKAKASQSVLQPSQPEPSQDLGRKSLVMVMRKLQLELPLNQTQKVRFKKAMERLQLLSSTTNNSVIIADSIHEDDFLLKGHGTSEVDGELLATVCGVVTHVDKLVYIHTLRARYKPEVKDIVVGRVIEVSKCCWRLELNSTKDGILKLSSMDNDVQRRKTYVDELNMRNIIVEDDVVCAEVGCIHRDGGMELQAPSHKYSKLEKGQLLMVDPYLVKKNNHHFHYIESLGIDLIIGRNGFIWVGEHIQAENPMIVDDEMIKHTSLETRKSILRIGNAIRVLSNLGFTVTLEVIMETVNLSNMENIDVYDMLGSEFHVLVAENEIERRIRRA
ncbi:unnamed protein product [Arabidopsis arenosa]|uniref:SWIM-type domain-containing protein n=1 Tax=Arabidopsis arenosa TaxID=38785 RepID=A0A8S1ZPY0_ARAAE|nr:unnamed protein product [Arabidopsis arenosa]